MFPKIDKTEMEKIAQVFRLDGTALVEKPLRYAYPRAPGDALGPPFRRSWAPYVYDGLPEYAAREPRFRKLGGMYLTMIDQLLFHKPPRRIYAVGLRWTLVAIYKSSGEALCENAWDPQDGRCPLCESDHYDEHNFIYIGDAWAEIVYRARE